MRAIYSLLLAGFFIYQITPASANDNSLIPFKASYEVFRNDKSVGEMILEVDKNDNHLRWQATTIPSGLYALISSKQPYSESILLRTSADYRLSSVRIATHITDEPQETALFDWQNSLMTARRKSKLVELAISENIYDYLSIHWLAAQMTLADASRYKLTFYRSGKLLKSTLHRKGTESLKIGDKTLQATVFEQDFEGSSRRLKYHYGQTNYWLPLRIERNKKGKKSVTMLLKSTNSTL